MEVIPEENYYYNLDEIFCNVCNNLCLINVNNLTNEIEYVCRLCSSTRVIIYCPYSHKLCIKNNNIYTCPLYGECKCTNNTGCYTNKLIIKNTIEKGFKFNVNLKYDNTYYRTDKIPCSCLNGKNPEHIIYMINNKTIDKAYICVNCNNVKLTIIKDN